LTLTVLLLKLDTITQYKKLILFILGSFLKDCWFFSKNYLRLIGTDCETPAGVAEINHSALLSKKQQSLRKQPYFMKKD
jgi:hypothetical protein